MFPNGMSIKGWMDRSLHSDGQLRSTADLPTVVDPQVDILHPNVRGHRPHSLNPMVPGPESCGQKRNRKLSWNSDVVAVVVVVFFLRICLSFRSKHFFGLDHSCPNTAEQFLGADPGHPIQAMKEMVETTTGRYILMMPMTFLTEPESRMNPETTAVQ